MPKFTTDQDLTPTQREMLAEIEGDFDAQGRFAVTNWPKPRVSNPNFLSEELARWKAENDPPKADEA